MKKRIILLAGSLFVFANAPAHASHNTPESLEARTAPTGTLNIVEASANTGNAPDALPESGETVYNTACIACHAAGVAGAPKLGDIDNWAVRIAQGMDLLVDHAINGFQGSTGVMPPKGGNAALSDEAVTAAVQFMVDQSQ